MASFFQTIEADATKVVQGVEKVAQDVRDDVTSVLSSPVGDEIATAVLSVLVTKLGLPISGSVIVAALMEAEKATTLSGYFEQVVGLLRQAYDAGLSGAPSSPTGSPGK